MSNLTQLDSQVCVGLRLFNKGMYFESHEALEIAWRAEKSPIRDLYRGILQVAVCYFHITRENHKGALIMYERSKKWLSRWPDVTLGIDVGQLREDLASVMTQLENSNIILTGDSELLLFKPIIYDQSLCNKQKAGVSTTSLFKCDRCGTIMTAWNCKVTCQNCGNRFDCSDLNIYFDDFC